MEGNSKSHDDGRKRVRTRFQVLVISFSGSTKMVSATTSPLVGDLHQDIARITMVPDTIFYICLGRQILPHDVTLGNVSVKESFVIRMYARLNGGGPRQNPTYPVLDWVR